MHRNPKNSHELLYCNIHYVVMVWYQTCNISMNACIHFLCFLSLMDCYLSLPIVYYLKTVASYFPQIFSHLKWEVYCNPCYSILSKSGHLDSILLTTTLKSFSQKNKVKHKVFRGRGYCLRSGPLKLFLFFLNTLFFFLKILHIL